MDTVQTILTVVIWFLCPILILLILVQGGAGDLSSTFGGGGQLDSSLGVGASRKMGKLTGWMSVVFLSIVLVMAIPPGGAYDQYHQGTSADEGEAVLDDPAETPAPPPSDADIEGAVEGVTAPAPAPSEVEADEAAPSEVDAPTDEAAPAEDATPAEAEADKQEAGLEIDVGAEPADEE